MTMTMSKNTLTCDNDNLLVSDEIKTILPDVLIGYLWKLVLCQEWRNYEEQLFILEVGELSGRGIQKIYHVGYNGNSMDIRRVYGVEPVACKLQVFNYCSTYKMQLCMSA